MRTNLIGVGIGMLLGALAVWIGLSGPKRAVVSATDAGESTASAGAEGAGAAGVRLDAATRERLGLEVAPLAALDLSDELRGFGRVLDPALLATPVHEREAARAAFDAAEREYERVKTLQRGNANASERELEAARVALERDRAAFEAADVRLVSVWGRAGVARADLPRLVHALVAGEISMARIDLSLGEALPGAAGAGRVAALADEGRGSVPAEILGPAPDSDPTTQGRGFLLLVERAPWPSGTALVGWLSVPGPVQTGVDVPVSALVRQAGRTFVYLQTGPDTFARRPLELERPTPDGWFVSSGLAAGDPVVVTGAQQLLSAELAESIEEE